MNTTQPRDKTMVSFQAPRELADRLAEAAREDDRSVSSVIRMAVAEHLEREHEGENT